MSEEDIVRMYLCIQPERRKQITEKLQREKAKEKINLLYAMIKIMTDITGKELNLKSRLRPDVDIRMVMAYALHKKGFSECEIGKALNKDHSLIHKYIDDMRFYVDRDFNSSLVKMYKEFKSKIDKYEIYR